MFIFYYAKSSAAYAPHILLEETGLEYEAVRIDFQTKEQKNKTCVISPSYSSLAYGEREKGGRKTKLFVFCVLKQKNVKNRTVFLFY